MGKPGGKRPRGKLDVKFIMNGRELDCTGLGYGQVQGCCDSGDEHLGSLNCGEFHE